MKPHLHQFKRVAVVRPTNPERAAAREAELIAQGGAVDLSVMLVDQPYIFVGIFAADQLHIIDEDGNVLSEKATGDLFVPYDGLKAQANIGDQLTGG